MGSLDGRVAIVTGSAQGIGAAYARGYAAEGAKVVVTDVLDTGPVVAELKATGADAIGVKSDITDEGQVQSLVATTLETYGKIDVLMNNAALFGVLKRQKFEEIDLEEFDAVLRINIRGVWQMTKAVSPVMRKREYGKIINIASGTVFKGTPMQLDYVTSKGAVIAMTRVLARELGEDNICVNAIAPGLTESEAVIEGGQFSAEHFSANIGSRCIKRPETPEDLVGTAVFLASADSDFITGQVLCVDGGSVTH
ncbi:SDR family oxidoreductase [Alphaproteobacteria bacterium]|nr:SDR family oxidoreductase [Alphaproteobacteria bacterium]